jgi:hypothetical protein
MKAMEETVIRASITGSYGAALPSIHNQPACVAVQQLRLCWMNYYAHKSRLPIRRKC